MAFEVTTMDLSMTSPETGNVLQANLYRVDGISRELSMGELVMSICLQRATQVEELIIQQMENMSKTTVNLETLTAIQNAIVNLNSNLDVETMKQVEAKYSTVRSAISGLQFYQSNGSKITLGVSDNYKMNSMQELYTFLRKAEEEGGAGCTSLPVYSQSVTTVTLIQTMSSRMDGLNSISQKDMINLQSMTNKRDQSYDLITNMLKSMNTVISATLNNYH